MLVMRTNMEGSPTFRELLARVREATLEAQEHADVPFEYVVKELQPQREQGQNPFFQVLLMLEPAVASLPSGWTLTHMEINTDSSKFDLSLIFEDRPEGLVGWFEYSTDLFEASTIERMMGAIGGIQVAYLVETSRISPRGLRKARLAVNGKAGRHSRNETPGFT